MSSPWGGPGAISTALAERFCGLGGELVLGASATFVRSEGDRSLVRWAEHEHWVDAVVSSAPRAPLGSSELRPGLCVATVHLTVDLGYAWPDGVHALAYMPSPISTWIEALDQGRQPEHFGLHCFDSGLERVDGCASITGFFMLPRGLEQPSEAQRALHLANLDHALGRIAPGLLEHLRQRVILYPPQYRELVGCDPRPAAWIYAPGSRKPAALDPDTGIYHVGNSVEPPGEHAGGAALSGWRAAEAVHAQLD